MERLQKVIARSGLTSRRKAEELIKKGKVKVNGQVAELGTKVKPTDEITVDDQTLMEEELHYYLFNKPDKVITSVSDNKGRKTVMDFFEGKKERLYPVGRLDYHTTGVLLVTNDGELANRLMHPSKEIEKVYVAKVQGIPTKEALKELERGVVIDGKKTAKARVELIKNKAATKNAQVRLAIHEGRNRQVRKMLEKVGYPVKQLRRESYAFLTTEGLSLGSYRELTPKEVKKLYGLSNE